jgi:hypothetical protein
MLRMSWRAAPETIAAFKAKGPRLVQVLSTKITILMSQLSSYVAREKLSGQMLKVQTGLLRASVHPVPTEIQGTKIVGSVVAAESPVSYGVALEKGSRAHQVLAVKANLLRFIIDGKAHFAKSVQIPAQAPRPFMALSEAENASMIYEELNKSVGEVINE